MATNNAINLKSVGVVYYDAAGTFTGVATATANQALLSGSNAAPSWSTATYPATTTAFQLLVSTAANTIGGLTAGTGGQLLVGVTGAVPTFSTTVAGLTGDNKITFTTSVSGEARWLEVINTSNTSSSTARIQATVAGGTAGDADFQAFLTGGQGWTWGLDNSDSDAYVLSASTALGTTNVMRVATTGEINYPLQSAFLAYANGNLTDKTGDGTDYTVVFNTEVFDQNSDFDGTSTFTAPVTGRYSLSTTLSVAGILSTHTVSDFSIVTSNRTAKMRWGPSKVFNANTQSSVTQTILVDMDAGDTATVHLTVFNGTKVIDLLGSADLETFFSGYLVC